ncbi:hypothetical protein FM111_00200 [Brevundimonas diminuta 3F5N]|uniref:Uncharacterized protein n=1 Tax=Brevundimonas diminuta 3F5N TaxID=1255603 RepID=A0A1R4EQA0_BREDI|nr:hypothetical protein FM111_00200 [Brevundimonas diminuta 3F5N]
MMLRPELEAPTAPGDVAWAGCPWRLYDRAYDACMARAG